MLSWKNIPANRNLFSMFERGKDFFAFRAFVEGALILVGIFAIVILVQRALDLYPTLIRTHNGTVMMGNASQYTPKLVEIQETVREVIEGLHLRTEKGIPSKQLSGYVADSILKDYASKPIPSGSKTGFVQTGLVTSLFLDKVTPNGVTGFCSVEIVVNSAADVLVDTVYYSVRFNPTQKSLQNPSGWRLTGIKLAPRDVFLQEQARILGKEDAQPATRQNMLELTY